jgi:DNA-binding LacI/PurR family transcriptional regulator/DNA-binding transcriptional regulator YhcF (GntR family)
MGFSINGPAIQKGFSFIRDNLEKAVWKPGQSLPSTKSLAAAAQISIASMTRAISILKSDHLVHVTRRGHIWAGSEGTSSFANDTAQGKEIWQMKRAQLEQHILSGTFAQQKGLPSLKELQAKYGVSFLTMRKILRSMVDDGVLQLRGKKYELNSISSLSFQQRIVFITYDSPIALSSALNQGQNRILDQLEQECVRKEIKLEIVEIDFYNSVEARKTAASPIINSPSLGYILDVWWYPNEEYRNSYIDFLTRLVSLKKPVAILDEIGDFVLPIQFASNPLIQVFRIEGKKAGSRIARLMLGLGHQSVAYISSIHDNFWSQQRLEGIMEQYSKAGCKEGVKAITGEGLEPNHEDIFALSGFDDTLIRKMLTMTYSKSLAKEMFDTFARSRQTARLPKLSTDAIQEMQMNLGIIRELVRRAPRKDLFKPIFNTVFADIGIFLSSKVRSPLFRQALTCKDITAWICATDGIAITALSFLRDNDIKIPRDISVVGFDNTPVTALEHRLTSFDFNSNGFVHRMLNHIARPPKPRGPYHHVPIELEGIVMQRDTTAPPRSNV